MTRPPSPAAAVQSTLLERFDAALDAERDALLAGAEERLAQAARAKSLLVDAIIALDWTAPSSAGSAVQARLRVVAEKNRRNGLLIAERLGEVQRRRQFFEHAAGRNGVYGPDGVTVPASAPSLSARI
jgi:flagellar biosynthesis/type III secretory pathway chaperone